MIKNIGVTLAPEQSEILPLEHEFKLGLSLRLQFPMQAVVDLIGPGRVHFVCHLLNSVLDYAFKFMG